MYKIGEVEFTPEDIIEKRSLSWGEVKVLLDKLKLPESVEIVKYISAFMELNSTVEFPTVSKIKLISFLKDRGVNIESPEIKVQIKKFLEQIKQERYKVPFILPTIQDLEE
jgi:hypothetical protein